MSPLASHLWTCFGLSFLLPKRSLNKKLICTSLWRGSLELGMTEQRRCDWKGGKSDINVHFWGHWGEQMLCHVPTMCKAVVLALRILGWLNYRQELRVLRKNQISNKYLYKEINNWSLQRSSVEEKVYSAVREWKRK